MLEVLAVVLLAQETSGAAEEVPTTMVARMMDHGRALELELVIVDRFDVLARTARIVADRCVGEETGTSVTIVDRCDVEIGRRCVMATEVALAVACAALTEVTVAMVEIVGMVENGVELTLAAAETVGMIVVRDARVETVAIRGVVHRRKIVGEAVLVAAVVVAPVLELEANPVETGEIVRLSRLNRGMNHDVWPRRGPRKHPVPPFRMRTVGRT